MTNNTKISRALQKSTAKPRQKMNIYEKYMKTQW